MNPIPAGLAANAPDVEIDIEQNRLFNADLAPVPQSRRKWGMLSFAALWISMSACIPTYMLASGAHRRRHELVAGHPHDFSRQPHRADPDGPQRARRNKLRNSISGLLPRVVRDEGREHAGDSPRTRRLRMVRHPDVDRRRGNLQNLRDDYTSTSRTATTGSASRADNSFASCFSGASTCSSSIAASRRSAGF